MQGLELDGCSGLVSRKYLARDRLRVCDGAWAINGPVPALRGCQFGGFGDELGGCLVQCSILIPCICVCTCTRHNSFASVNHILRLVFWHANEPTGRRSSISSGAVS